MLKYFLVPADNVLFNVLPVLPESAHACLALSSIVFDSVHLKSPELTYETPYHNPNSKLFTPIIAPGT